MLTYSRINIKFYKIITLLKTRYEISLTIRVILLLASITAAAFCIVSNRYTLLIFIGLMIIFQILNFIQFINKTNTELSQFIEIGRAHV